MTFVEAAVQILRREGKPLHIKELTRLAIKHNLLSVVGRDPEAMMETRLMIEAKRPSADLVRVSPGVFGLRTYPPRNERGEAVKSEGEKVSKPKAEPTGTPAKDHRGGKRRRSGRGAEGIEPSAAAAPAETASPAAPPAVVAPAATPAATSSEPAVERSQASAHQEPSWHPQWIEREPHGVRCHRSRSRQGSSRRGACSHSGSSIGGNAPDGAPHRQRLQHR